MRWLAIIIIGCIFIEGCVSLVETDIPKSVCISPYNAYYYKTCEIINFSVNDRWFQLNKGFVTNLASIPRFFWPIISPSHSSIMNASIVHDWLYSESCYFSRKDADTIFYSILRKDGVSSFKAYVMYSMVRVFGFRYFSACHKPVNYSLNDK